MLDLLRQTVETVQQDADASPETFIAANNALQTGLQSQARKIDRRTAADRYRARRDKLELARLQANAEIAGIVGARAACRASAPPCSTRPGRTR